MLVLRGDELVFQFTAYLWAFACLGVAEPRREGRRQCQVKKIVLNRCEQFAIFNFLCLLKTMSVLVCGQSSVVFASF